jgi:signal transduction histidine kinase
MTSQPKSNILLVDDRVENLIALEAILSALGQNLFKARSGEEALRCLLNQDFAVILLDVQMPGMDGFETASLIRQRERSQHTPIIFLTAFDTNSQLQMKGYALGAVDYLLKPINPEILVSKVTVFVELFQKTQQIQQQSTKLAMQKIEIVQEQLARQQAEIASRMKEDRNQELDNFVHIVSHDLKAPLRAISNLSQWIEEEIVEVLSVDTRKQMELLRSRVHRMEIMIDGLLDYARVGRTNATIESVAVEELLAEVIDSLAPPATFQIEIAPGMPTLYTKRLLLSQVFSNLVSNAIRHHEKSDGSIRIWSQDKGDFCEFAVADDGPGIAPAYHEKIFMIFQAGHPQNKVGSSGVGLSIVKRIVETEGGTIHLESEQGKGSTFYFTWPQ